MNKYFIYIYIYILQLGYFPSFEKRRGKEICLKNISLRYFIFISIILINRNNNTLLYFY